MLSRSFLLGALTLVFAAMAGCEQPRSRGSDDDDDSGPTSGSGAMGGGVSSNCPDSPVFSDMTCIGSIEGEVCPGTMICSECGSVTTPCTCVVYEAGYHFQCSSDCDVLCNGTGGAGGQGGTTVIPPTTCQQFCAPQLAATCPEPSTCLADCQQLESAIPPQCADAWNTTKWCGSMSPVECNAQGVAQPTDCDDELAAVTQCVGL